MKEILKSLYPELFYTQKISIKEAYEKLATIMPIEFYKSIMSEYRQLVYPHYLGTVNCIFDAISPTVFASYTKLGQFIKTQAEIRD